jgi:hypothetical protein
VIYRGRDGIELAPPQIRSEALKAGIRTYRQR